MNHTRLILIHGILCVLLICMSCSSSSGSLDVSTKVLDFGSVNVGESKSLTVTITNKYSKEIEISGVNLSDTTNYSITSTLNTPFDLAKDQTFDITIKYEPTIAGDHDTELKITYSNSSKEKIVNLGGTGVPAPIISVSTTNVPFGKYVLNTKVSYKVEVENIGTADLEIDSLQISGAGASAFSMTFGGTAPVTVVPGAKHGIVIQFLPTAITTYTASLNIGHNGVIAATPVVVNLSGEGRDYITKAFAYTGSIASWTVPAGITSITIEAWGAQGGINDANQVGGWGAQIKGTFTVTPGDTLKLLVGEQGVHGSTASWSRCGGGSGGSFIWKDGDNMPMIAAGGGGGKGYLYCSNSMDASTTTSGVQGKHPGGTNGNGGTGGTVLSDDGAGGGGGWLTDGTGLYPGSKIYNGTGAGGVSAYNDGGFGGGGGSSNSAGGGGGYSGGGGGFYGSNTSPQYNGGGGGSYNAGTNQSNVVGSRTGDGYIIISY